MSINIQSRVIETRLVKWRDFEFIQRDNLKDLSPDAKKRLKQSLLENSFSQPFFAWEDSNGTEFCLDGRHRTIALVELSREGHNIPEELPATFIHCSGTAEAARLVLVFSSMYAKITEGGLSDFLEMYDLDLKQLESTIDIPGLNNSLNDDKMVDPFSDSGVGVKNQFGVIVMCEDEIQQEHVFKQLTADGLNCKVVVT